MKLYAQLSKDLKKVESVRHVSDGLIEQYEKLDQFKKQKPPFRQRIRPVVDEGTRPDKPHKESFKIEADKVVRSFELLPEPKAAEAGEKVGAGESGSPISGAPSPNSEPAPVSA